MLRLGFWRGFRSDELTRLHVENIVVEPGVGLTCFLPYSKGDREANGQTFRCPALSRLCPVAAYEQWLTVSEITAGPVFRRIDRWGHLGEAGLAVDSVLPWLRDLFAKAGVEAPQTYSSHSLRRGFAGWAQSSGWELKELMEYVGWRDIRSAMRYLETSTQGLQTRFETGLEATLEAPRPSLTNESNAGPARPVRLRRVK